MSIIDGKKLLTNEEKKEYEHLLTCHGFQLHHFLVEATEDQSPMDMNDINYIIIVNIKVVHVKNNAEKTYYSKSGSKTWISEFENDLMNKYYSNLDSQV